MTTIVLDAKIVRKTIAVQSKVGIPGQAGAAVSFQRGATFVGAPVALPINDVPVTIPVACAIAEVTILTAGGPGSCTIDIWRDSYAAYPPTVADSICAGNKPAISGGTKFRDATLTGWSKTLAAGDVVTFKLESASNFTLVDITLTLEPT